MISSSTCASWGRKDPNGGVGRGCRRSEESDRAIVFLMGLNLCLVSSIRYMVVLSWGYNKDKQSDVTSLHLYAVVTNYALLS